MSGYDSSGLRQLYAKTQRMEQDFDRFLRQFLLKQGLSALSDTKANTPVDTGLLRAAWTLGDATVAARGRWNEAEGKVKYTEDRDLSAPATLESVKRVGNMLEITISNPVEYASFVEHGHMTSNRKGWVNGRFMCQIAITRVRRKMPARFRTEFEQWLRRMDNG